jgi:DNA invertase Pin-like site-specific DNA recombinase
MIDPVPPVKLKPWHLDRWAIVYIRQSDPQQLINNRESTALQYALRDRALALGWPNDRILTLDGDQGKSATTADGRFSFHYLLAEVALGHVGLILGREVSRPARNCKDWFPLLEMCARFGTLLGDRDGLYDPTDPNDRLLLGIKGIMSEAELHLLKARMNDAKLNKAGRGELVIAAPIGYVKTPSGNLVIDPDEQVQAVVRLIFEQFDRQGTIRGVLHYLVHNHIDIPVRSRRRTNQGELCWRKPHGSTLRDLLHHPIYAGAYRYGRRAVDPSKQRPGARNSGKRCLPAAQCLVLIRDHLPGYISWEQFEGNQRRLLDNRASWASRGAPRQGAALLGGLIRCGRCGQRMQVCYGGRKSGPYYRCQSKQANAEPSCQVLAARVVDELAADQVLAAVRPAALEASLAAVADAERERAELLRQWSLKIERADYEVKRAFRQYDSCEPENRLVARALERRWEEALKQQRQLAEEFDRFKQSTPSRLSAAEREAIRALAADLPAVWRAATTTAQERKQLVRLLLERVSVLVDKGSEGVDVRLHWVGGLVAEHALRRPVSRYQQQADYPRLVERLKELRLELLSSSEIADKLNAEGFRPPRQKGRFNAALVLRLLSRLGLGRGERHGGNDGLGNDEYRPGDLARRLGLSRDTLKRWAHVGWVNARQDEQGHSILWADADEMRRLRELFTAPRTWANKERLVELKKPKQRPAT